MFLNSIVNINNINRFYLPTDIHPPGSVSHTDRKCLFVMGVGRRNNCFCSINTCTCVGQRSCCFYSGNTCIKISLAIWLLFVANAFSDMYTNPVFLQGFLT